MYPTKLEAETQNTYFYEKDYFQKKFHYIHTFLHRDYKYKMHAHQFYEINIIISGNGRHYIGDTFIDTEEGDIFVIPPNISHGYYSERRLDIYHILIKNDFFIRYAEELSEIDGFNLMFDIEPQIRQMSGKRYNIKYELHKISSIKEELKQLMRAEEREEHVYLNALTLAFICRLCKRIKGAVSVSQDNDIISIMDYIKNNIDSKITLKGLAEMLHVSVSTLNRKFKAVMGKSPMEYVLECRISEAERLIEENEMKRTDIAHSCGFYDSAHLNKYLHINSYK